MRDLSYGLFIRAQYHAGDDMAKRFQEVVAQVRLADKLGFADVLTGMHYASAPYQQYQQLPLLARLMAETETMRIVAGIRRQPHDRGGALGRHAPHPPQPFPRSALHRAASSRSRWYG